MVKLLVKRVGPVEVPLPRYQTKGAVGMDLHAALLESVVLAPGERRALPTGLAFAIPEGYEGQVRARSSTARHHGVTMANGVGTIDPDFRGELEVLVINLGQEFFQVKPLQRIAQFVISPVIQVEPEVVLDLEETERGAGGFGSTGN